MDYRRAAVLTFLSVFVGLSLVFVGTSAGQTAPDCSNVSYNTDTDGAFLVGNVDQLQCMGDANTTTSLSDDFRLDNDIDASGTTNWNGGSGFKPVGNLSVPFNGSLDGDGNAVTGLYMNRTTDELGLFGATDNATVRDLGIEDVYINGSTSSSDSVGALVGRANRTEVYDTYSTGEVTGYYYVGGLIGYARADYGANAGGGHTIKRSYSEAYVLGPGCCSGGLTGPFEGGTIEDSYATGNVSALNCCAGGLAGWIDNRGSEGGGTLKTYVNDSYATGNVTGRDCCMGGLAGWVEHDSYVEDSYATGDIKDRYCCSGGFAGWVEDTAVINKSYATGDVDEGDCCAGGFVGGIYNTGEVRNSFSTGDVEGRFCCVGGFVGDGSATGGLVYRSVSTGDVKELGGGYAGGFGGYVDNVNITESYSTGKVESNETYAGGFVAYLSGNSRINKSYARGNATGNDSVGGFVGYHTGTSEIDEVYSTGVPTATNATNVGGLVGVNNSGGPITNAYWDQEASGTTISDGGTPLTTSQMTGSAATTNMVGFDFTNTWSTVPGGYPILQNSPDLSFLFEDEFTDRRELGRGQLDRHPLRDRELGRGESRRDNYQNRDTRRRNTGRGR